MGKLKLCFPRLGDYHVAFHSILKVIYPQAEVVTPPPMTKETVALGTRNSPDSICAPFKYNLGNYIQALEQGANVLFQT